MEHSGGKQTT